MQFGLAIFPTERTADPMTIARAAEDGGFESLFFPEHTHIPASRTTPYPGGGELPSKYWETYDPFVALSAAAAVTSTLKLATGICLVIERDPIVTAKEVATIDALSGGRFLFGVGAGWNVEEMANHGTDSSRRFGVLRERIEAMKAIWADEEAAYHGEHVSFDAIWSRPKPVQRPHPPILVGGNGRSVLERVIAYGDEWLPNAVGDIDKLSARISKLGDLASAAGRTIGVTVYGARPRAEEIERYARAGAGRCVFWLPTEPAAEVLARIDRLSELIR